MSYTCILYVYEEVASIITGNVHNLALEVENVISNDTMYKPRAVTEGCVILSVSASCEPMPCLTPSPLGPN
jgi:hypothetical protein